MHKILLKLSSISPEFKKVIDLEEVKKQVDNIDFKDVNIFDEKDITEIKKNTKRDAIIESEKNIIEKTVASLKLEGVYNDINSIIKASEKKAIENAKIPVDKKVSELESQLQTAQSSLTEFETKLSKKNSEIQKIKVDSKIYSKLPKNLPVGLTKEEAVQILKMGANPVFENEKYFTEVNGQKLQDDKGNHIEYDNYISSKIEQKGWLETQDSSPGKGGGHVPGSNGKINSVSDINNLNDFNEYLESKGIDNENSMQAQSILSKAMENKNFKSE